MASSKTKRQCAPMGKSECGFFCLVGHRVARCAGGCIRKRKPLGNLMDPRTWFAVGEREAGWEGGAPLRPGTVFNFRWSPCEETPLPFSSRPKAAFAKARRPPRLCGFGSVAEWGVVASISGLHPVRRVAGVCSIQAQAFFGGGCGSAD